MPNVNFYWVGDGQYREKITTQLEKYENFKWLGMLECPEEIRNFLEQLLEDSEFAVKMGIEGARFVKQEFNWEKVTGMLMSLNLEGRKIHDSINSNVNPGKSRGENSKNLN